MPTAVGCNFANGMRTIIRSFILKNPKSCATNAQNWKKRLTEYSGLGGITIPEPKSVQDLDVDMSDDTYSQVHSTKMTTKCRHVVGWNLRTFRIGEITVVTLSRIYALNRLDCCFQLWSCHNVQLIANLEAIQRSFAKKNVSLQHFICI